MFLKFIRDNFLPQEIVILPFTLLVLLVYRYFELDFVFVPEFIYWLISILILFLMINVAIHYASGMQRYLFNNDIKNYSVNLIKIKRFLRILISLILVLVIYENLQFAISYISPIDQDEALLFYDNLLFGSTHVTLLFQPFVSKLLTEWFSFAYLSFFFYLPILGVYLFFTDKIKEWSLLVLTISITLFSGYILYLFFPALGPGVYLQPLYTVDLHGLIITPTTSSIVNTQGFARGTFPSLHMACSVVYLYFAYKNSRILFVIFLPFIVSLWISTLYLRHHYVIDLIAGLFLAIICIYLAYKIDRKWNAAK